MFTRLSKADARVQNNVRFLHPSLYRQLHTDKEFAFHIFDQVLIFWPNVRVAQLLAHFHTCRVAPVVHQNHRDAKCRGNGGKLRVRAQRPHVIEDVCARIESSFCNLRLVGINWNWCIGEFFDNRFDSRNDALHLFIRIDGLWTRSCRFSADIEDICILSKKFFGLLESMVLPFNPNPSSRFVFIFTPLSAIWMGEQ